MAIDLTLTEADLLDLPNKGVGLEEKAARIRVLGGRDHEHSEKKKLIEELLPAVIARKIKGLIPNDFDITEISMKISVAGTIFGTGVSGDVDVKFAPKK